MLELRLSYKCAWIVILSFHWSHLILQLKLFPKILSSIFVYLLFICISIDFLLFHVIQPQQFDRIDKIKTTILIVYWEILQPRSLRIRYSCSPLAFKMDRTLAGFRWIEKCEQVFGAVAGVLFNLHWYCDK